MIRNPFLKLVGVAAIVALAGAAFMCGQDVPEKRTVAAIGADGVQRVDVLGGSYFFDPNVIVVKVNVPVELRVRKEPGATAHNIVLNAPEAGIVFSISLSTTPTSINFTPTKTGKYSFECTHKFLFFKSHKDQGMHGILEVVD
jgi:plastocyanin domain-containing protein